MNAFGVRSLTSIVANEIHHTRPSKVSLGAKCCRSAVDWPTALAKSVIGVKDGSSLASNRETLYSPLFLLNFSSAERKERPLLISPSTLWSCPKHSLMSCFFSSSKESHVAPDSLEDMGRDERGPEKYSSKVPFMTRRGLRPLF